MGEQAVLLGRARRPVQGARLDSLLGLRDVASLREDVAASWSRTSPTGWRQRGYPFDIAYVRWSGHGDNAVPDPAICEFVRDWNAKYAWPRFIISGTSEAFRAFEQRYGDKLPVVRGDWTPYWEDGAGSSALETAMNRASSDRLAQAETLFAMLKPSEYSAAVFEEAWNKVLLYSEHTWGAWCSVERAAAKRDPGAMGDQARLRRVGGQAVSRAVGRVSWIEHDPIAMPAAIDVFNTLSWPRTELVTLSKELSADGDRVADEAGRPVPSQRLASGELVFLARDVPPFAARRYTVSPGTPHAEDRAVAQGATLDNGVMSSARGREDRRHRRIDGQGHRAATSPTRAAARP